MGQAVLEAASRDSEVNVAGQIDLGDALMDSLPACDAVIDFSYHGFTTELAQACLDLRKQLVIGTTGHNAEELIFLQRAAAKLPIVFAPNFSVGVNVLFWTSRKVAEILGTDYDIEVIEMHHRMKKDAPSGTAKRLGEILSEARRLSYESDTRHGRVGDVGARSRDEIGMHALRGGDVVGDHTVAFATLGERLELTHRASSRDTFATGAVRAAKWLSDKPPGLYDMQDVLGLR